jgi:hypothetical protein
MVEFPLNNLDLSNFIQDHNFLKMNDITCQYDLCGVINHYGSLTYGHYVSNVKNPYDHKWYKYDDHFRIPIEESQLSKESAYILFYVRKDINSKQLQDIFPSSSQIFPGLPLRTKFGDGFVLGPKRPEEGENEVSIYYVQISKRVEVHEMQVTEILKILEREEIYNETPYTS